MGWLIAVIIALVCAIGLMYRFGRKSSQEQALKVDKGILETKLKDLELEKGILIKHAKDAHKETITSKKQLAEVKSDIIKNYDYNNIGSVMDYINGTD